MGTVVADWVRALLVRELDRAEWVVKPAAPTGEAWKQRLKLRGILRVPERIVLAFKDAQNIVGLKGLGDVA